MRVRHSSRRIGGTIGLALVLATVAVIGAASADGHPASATMPAVTKDKLHEQQDIAKLKATVAHIETNFSVLPPEINSLRMFAGAGSAPMLEASKAWGALSAELEATMRSYESVMTELAASGWQGTSSQAMDAAAAPYVAWLNTATQQAEATAAQAQAAAAQLEASLKGAGAT